MPGKPLVSIIVPNYNHARFLAERLDSILNQSYRHFEVIILDDASTDDSLAVIQTFEGHPCIHQVIVNPRNSGGTFAQWNRGVAAAQGELIWIAESDDVARPQLLERLVGCFDDPDVVVAYSRSRLIGEKGQPLGGCDSHVPQDSGSVLFSQDFCLPGPDFLQRGQLRSNLIPNASAVVFRRSAYLACGGADVRVQKCGDWLLWCKILLAGHVFFISEALNDFRRHDSSVINRVRDKLAPFNYDLVFHDVLDQYLHTLNASPALVVSIIDCNRKEVGYLYQSLSLALARSRKWAEAKAARRKFLNSVERGGQGAYHLRYAVAFLRGFLRGR